jgi:hypothetical protein
VQRVGLVTAATSTAEARTFPVADEFPQLPVLTLDTGQIAC